MSKAPSAAEHAAPGAAPKAAGGSSSGRQLPEAVRIRLEDGFATPLDAESPWARARAGLGGRAPAAPDRAAVEQRTGVDLGGVRVHDDPGARSFVRALGARAASVGTTILRDGELSAAEMRHELAHVAQHGARRADPTRPLTVGARDAAAERDAWRVAAGARSNVAGDPNTVRRTDGSFTDFLPRPVEYSSRESQELSARGLTSTGPIAVDISESSSPTENRSTFVAQGMATDETSGVTSATRFEILERIPPPSWQVPTYAEELTFLDEAKAYDIEVRYRRVLAYVDQSGDHLTVSIDGWLGFTTGQWNHLGLIGVYEPTTFADLLDKRASAGSYTISITAVGRIGEVGQVITGVDPTLQIQYESAASRLMDIVEGTSSGLTLREPDVRTGFLAPGAAIGQQHEAARGFLTWYLESVEARMRAQLDEELPKDLARIKSKLVEERIDGDDERQIVELVRKWSQHRDILLPSGQSYFDAFLTDLRQSTRVRDWGLFETGEISFWGALHEDVEEKVGQVTGLIASNSREYGHYIAPWDTAAQNKPVDKKFTNQVTGQVLGALEGWTDSDDEQVVLETMIGLPPQTQREVLQEMMRRYDETEYVVFGRYGEAWEGGMLFWLFEELESGDRDRLRKDLVAKGVLTQDTADALYNGRGWGGEWLPFTTRKAQESAQYWAELANEGHDWAYVPGVFASMWLPETAGTTAATLTGARVFPGLARIHPYIETGMLTAGTLLSSYELGIHAQELITGKDPYTGRELTKEEMLSSALLTLSSGLFLGAGFMSAPGTQQRMFEVGSQKFPLPSEFEATPVKIAKFTQPGQKLMEPFADEGVAYVRHSRTGEIFEIRGTANGNEASVTRVSTGERWTFGPDGKLVSSTRVPKIDVTTATPDIDIAPGISVQSTPPSTAMQTTPQVGGQITAVPMIGPGNTTSRTLGPTGPVRVLSTSARYHVEDAADPDLWAIGEVKDGVLDLNLQTRYVAPDGRVVRGALRGEEQFDAIVKHFEGQFTAIRGSWHMGDNIAHFRMTRNPYTTWTGIQAARHGFTEATEVDRGFLPGTNDDMGGGEYDWVEFLFRR